MSQDNGAVEICPPSGPTYVPSSRKDAARSRIRKWKRNQVKWLASRAESFSGATYADALERGSARPYELGGDVVHRLREVMSARAVELLGHVLACERGFGGNRGGVRLRHADAARILRCHERTAGDAMRELQKLGLVEARWHFTVLASDIARSEALDERRLWWHKHRERTPCYVTTAAARELCGKRERRITRAKQVGRKSQPGRNHPPLRGGVKGAPGRGRPAHRFVEAVRQARQAETDRASDAAHHREAGRAVVIERLPDGRCALGSPLTPGVGRLSNERVSRVAVDDTTAEYYTTLCRGAWDAIAASERKDEPS